MDRFPVPMPRPLRLAAALLIASVAIGCQGDNPAAPGSSPELCVKVRGSSSMLRLGCLGDLLGLEE